MKVLTGSFSLDLPGFPQEPGLSIKGYHSIGFLGVTSGLYGGTLKALG